MYMYIDMFVKVLVWRTFEVSRPWACQLVETIITRLNEGIEGPCQRMMLLNLANQKCTLYNSDVQQTIMEWIWFGLGSTPPLCLPYILFQHLHRVPIQHSSVHAIYYTQSTLRRPEAHTFHWKIGICTAPMGVNNMRAVHMVDTVAY